MADMAKKLTRRELVKRISKETGVPVNKVYPIVIETFRHITRHLCDAGDVSIYNFGEFKTISWKENVGRNPSTGEQFIIPAHKRAVFKMGKNLKATMLKIPV